MKYLVLGPSFVNDVVRLDGSRDNNVLGGAIYCVAGIKVWDDSVLYVSNVGDDFESCYGPYMEANELSSAGLLRILRRTQHTELRYGSEGIHDEVSVYGPAEDAYNTGRDEISAPLVASLATPASRGVYIEASESDPFWEEFAVHKALQQAVIMWEPPTSACFTLRRRERVKEVIARIGLYSINGVEARELFGVDTQVQVVAAIRELGTTCLLRLGEQGACLVEADAGATFVPSLIASQVVDLTGCGNAATAAALVGIVEGRSAREVVAMANISAYLTLGQLGPIQWPAGKRQWARRQLHLVAARGREYGAPGS